MGLYIYKLIALHNYELYTLVRNTEIYGQIHLAQPPHVAVAQPYKRTVHKTAYSERNCSDIVRPERKKVGIFDPFKLDGRVDESQENMKASPWALFVQPSLGAGTW